MRKRFEQQISLGTAAIGDVEINLRSRHQLPPVLSALQHIFTTRELSEQVFNLLEDKILGGKEATGRLGLSLWEILVLSCVRLSLDIDYDFLIDLANNHVTLRGILGVSQSDLTGRKEYKLQTLKDNVGQLDEQTIREINIIVVRAGYELIKKKEEKEDLDLSIKMDSYVLEGNIHFPTDMNLLWDSGRKCLDVIEYFLKAGVTLSGWRKYDYTYKNFHRHYRRISEVHRKKGKNYQERLKPAAEKYLAVSKKLSNKIEQSMKELCDLVSQGALSVLQYLTIEDLRYYLKMLDKHRDLVCRRILKGEKIPHKEKVFSIFEPHIEWISKGKMHKKVELGHNVVIATDQYQFIVDYQVMIHQSDPEMGLLLGQRIIETYGAEHQITSMSFDRGFYSSTVKQALSKDIEQIIMPKPGKKSIIIEQEENQSTFVELRKAHSAVESNINQLEQNGLNRCPDKGENGFKRYAALGVLAYNLHHLGKQLMQQKAQVKQLERLKKAG